MVVVVGGVSVCAWKKVLGGVRVFARTVSLCVCVCWGVHLSVCVGCEFFPDYERGELRER